MNEFVEGGLWEPQRIRWDHPKIEKYIEDNWKEKGDKELAEDLSEITGKNITPGKTQEKRLDMGLKRSSGNPGNLENNRGREPKIDWQSPEVKKYIQTRYQDQGDLEIARGLSEKYDKDITWKMVKDHRLDMGYKKEPRSKERGETIDLGQPKYRRYIYDNHPQLNGDYDTISKFLVAFYDKFDMDISIRSLKRKMRKFINSDPAVKNMKEIRLSELGNDKISRWI